MAKVLPVPGFLRKTESASQGSVFRLAAPHPTMTGIITVAGITHEAIEPQAIGDKGLRQVDFSLNGSPRGESLKGISTLKGIRFTII